MYEFDSDISSNSNIDSFISTLQSANSKQSVLFKQPYKVYVLSNSHYVLCICIAMYWQNTIDVNYTTDNYFKKVAMHELGHAWDFYYFEKLTNGTSWSSAIHEQCKSGDSSCPSARNYQLLYSYYQSVGMLKSEISSTMKTFADSALFYYEDMLLGNLFSDDLYSYLSSISQMSSTKKTQLKNLIEYYIKKTTW